MTVENRYTAANAIGIECPVRNYEGDDQVGFVISANLRRRQLTASQCSLIAARLANMRQGERTDIEHPANLPKVSQAQAAELCAVSERLVRDGKYILDHGSPELINAVERGKTKVSDAVKQLRHNGQKLDPDKLCPAAPAQIAATEPSAEKEAGTGQAKLESPNDHRHLCVVAVDFDPKAALVELEKQLQNIIGQIGVAEKAAAALIVHMVEQRKQTVRSIAKTIGRDPKWVRERLDRGKPKQGPWPAEVAT